MCFSLWVGKHPQITVTGFLLVYGLTYLPLHCTNCVLLRVSVFAASFPQFRPKKITDHICVWEVPKFRTPVNTVSAIWFMKAYCIFMLYVWCSPSKITPPYLPRKWEREVNAFIAVWARICGCLREGGLCWEWPFSEEPLYSKIVLKNCIQLSHITFQFTWVHPTTHVQRKVKRTHSSKDIERGHMGFWKDVQMRLLFPVTKGHFRNVDRLTWQKGCPY